MTTKLIVSAGFLVAFAAGLVTGVQRHDVIPQKPTNPGPLMIPTTGPTTRPPRTPPPSFLAQSLGLSNDQRTELTRIWEPVVRDEQDMRDKRLKLRQARDEKIVALANAENRAEYEKILSDFYGEMDKMDEEWLAIFNKAKDLSEQLMTLDQRKQYEQILSRVPSDRQGRGRGGPRGGRQQFNGARGPGEPFFGQRGPRGDGPEHDDHSTIGGQRAGDGTTTRPAAN